MAEEKKTTISGMEVDEYAKFAEATLFGPTKIKNLKNRLKKEQRKLDKLVRESENLFYGESIDTESIKAQETVITNINNEITKAEQDLQKVTDAAKKSQNLENAYQDVIDATNRVNELRTAAEAKKEVLRRGGKGFVLKEKPTPQVVAQAEQELKDAQQRVKEVESGKTAKELAQEVADQQAQRGSGGSQTADIGTVTGAGRKSTVPLGAGEVNLGLVGSIQTSYGTTQAQDNIQTTDYALGLFYSSSTAGQQIRNQLRSTLASFGVKDVSEAKLEAYWKDAVSNTSAANQADNPNQSIWDTLKSSLSAASQAGELGGDKTGPSAEAIKSKKETVKLLSTQLGVKLTDNQINDLAYRYANGELDATTINFRIAKIGEIDFSAGEAANTLNELKIKAADYGILYGSDWYNQSAKKILTGEIDQDTINQQIMDLAKSQFPTLSARIDEGYTVKQLASPYIQSMAALLEINPADIGLQDLTIKQALTGIDQDGKPNTKPLWMFEQELRQDPRWNYTKNAQEATMGVARRVLQDFGLAY
jgi:myosin heavy subunit